MLGFHQWRHLTLERIAVNFHLVYYCINCPNSQTRFRRLLMSDLRLRETDGAAARGVSSSVSMSSALRFSNSTIKLTLERESPRGEIK
jgi:hypothetical protein